MRSVECLPVQVRWVNQQSEERERETRRVEEKSRREARRGYRGRVGMVVKLLELEQGTKKPLRAKGWV